MPLKASDGHVRVHILKPRFQARDGLIRRGEELHPLIELTDKAVCSPALTGNVEAAAECSAGLEHAERLAVGRLLIGKGVKAVERQAPRIAFLRSISSLFLC